jgi:hypothetical protein
MVAGVVVVVVIDGNIEAYNLLYEQMEWRRW